MPRCLTLSNSKELYRLPLDNIIFVEADGDYSDIMMADGKRRAITCQLGQIEEMLSQQFGTDGRNLVRIGRGLIINLDYLVFINPARKLLILGDCRSMEFSLSASKEALSELKAFYDRQMRSHY